MIRFLLLVNKQGQPRIQKYYEHVENDEKRIRETEIIRKCLSRVNENQCSFFEYKHCKIIFKKYATLYFILGVDDDENELATLEIIHAIVETFDKYFEKVCELDIMFNIDRVHMILDEIIVNGRIVETNKTRILAPIQVLDQAMQR